MLTDAELMLRKAVLLLTVLLVIVGLWGGARLLLLSEPEPVLPAPSSLQVGDLGAATASEDLLAHFVTRPVFWVGRTAYVVPPREDGEPEPEPPARNGDLDKVKLLGIFVTDSSATAIVMHKGKAQRLKLNESIEGWAFTFSSPDGALFKKGMESRALRIEHATFAAKPTSANRATNASGSPQTRNQGTSRRLDQAPARRSKNKDAADEDKKDKKDKKKKNKNKSESDKNKDGEK
jgi:hypothetical protein